MLTPAKRKPPNAGKGRVRGVPNKTTAVLKDAILKAAEGVGDEDHDGQGTVGYMKHLARTEPVAFATLLGKVLPLQVTGDGGGPVLISAAPLTADQWTARHAGDA